MNFIEVIILNLTKYMRRLAAAGAGGDGAGAAGECAGGHARRQRAQHGAALQARQVSHYAICVHQAKVVILRID